MDATPFLPGTPRPRKVETYHEPTGPVGLGGWLLFVGLGFVLGLPFLAFELHHTYELFFARPEVWAKLTTPGSKAYHPLWQAAIVFETVGNALRFLWMLALAFMFCTRKRQFKSAMIVYQLATIAYFWTDHYLAQQIMPKAAEHLPQLIGQTVGILVWVQYFLVSRRVESTFTE